MFEKENMALRCIVTLITKSLSHVYKVTDLCGSAPV